MSKGACIILGIAFGVLTLGFGGAAMFISGLEEMRGVAKAMVAMGPFYAIGSLACVFPASRPIALRLIGGTVFLAFLIYLISMMVSGPLLGNSRAAMSLVNSIIAFSVFGLPAGYVAITGRYPRWGRHAAAFEATNHRHP
jgi:hypothetical protein